MVRPILLAALLMLVPRAVPGQALGVLHIKMTLLDEQQQPTPVIRHALLISDNPASAPPRRTVTGLDGTVQVRLRPGHYTIESDAPVRFLRNSYEWVQTVEIVAGREVVVELSERNAETGPVTAATPVSPTPDSDPSFLFHKWQDSVVALWTPTTRATGFVIDPNGLVVTNQRVVGGATMVEVQLTATVKVAATVLAADLQREVALLWIDPAVATLRPMPLRCGTESPAIARDDEIFTIGVPQRQPKRLTLAKVRHVDDRSIASDLFISRGSAGGPAFIAGGRVVGITALADDQDTRLQQEARVIRIQAACDVVASAEKLMTTATRPSAALLPVEPARPFPVAALEEAAKRRAGSLNPYQLTSSDFDVSFITPILTYGARYQAEQARRPRGGKPAPPEPTLVRPLMDFGVWSDYVDAFPPVLLIRVTPRLVEGFWTMVARGAARTQGVSLPPIKRFKSGFLRMRAFCGDAEVTPIHPFRLEQRVSDTDAIYEGLYVFDPGALGPQCDNVKLVLHSEKEPAKADTRVVDAKVIDQIWQDFAPFRSASQ